MRFEPAAAVALAAADGAYSPLVLSLFFSLSRDKLLSSTYLKGIFLWSEKVWHNPFQIYATYRASEEEFSISIFEEGRKINLIVSSLNDTGSKLFRGPIRYHIGKHSSVVYLVNCAVL